MKRKTSGFNKEKLVFLGVATVLAICVYAMLASAPVVLEVPKPISTLSAPGPLDREKEDMRVSNVRYYLDDGKLSLMRDIRTGAIVDRSRANPFEPLRDPKPLEVAADKKVKEVKPVAPTDIQPPPPDEVVKEDTKNKPEQMDIKDPKAQVDFNAVMTMKGETVALLKTKEGATLQVKVGDYIDEFKYTVSRIEPQAIYVTDDENHTFVARDSSMDNSGDASTDTAPAKKPAPKAAPAAAGPKPAPPAAAKKPQAPGGGNRNNQNNQNQNKNQNRPQRQRGPAN